MRKKLNQYERLIKAVNTSTVILEFIYMFLVFFAGMYFGNVIKVSYEFVIFSFLGVALITCIFMMVSNNIINRRKLEWNSLPKKENILQSNDLCLHCRNDEKEMTIDKLFNGEEVICHDKEIGNVHIRIEKVEQDEK